MTIEVIQVDYTNPLHEKDLIQLLDEYSRDPMGSGKPLKDETRQKLASELAKIPHASSFIAYWEGQPAGLINCFETFSTFACKPLINIHDLVVSSQHRGKKISTRLLEAVEKKARERGCCKITLEVLEGNTLAQSAYKKFGFSGYELDPEMGKALFWEKSL